MADNDWAPATSGAGPLIATKDVSNFRHQKVIAEAESYGNYYPNIPDGGLVDGNIVMNQANADGLQEVRAAVITDEGSIYYPIVGTTAPVDTVTSAGTGQSVVFGSGSCVITLGNSINQEAYWSFPVDYAPMHAMVKIAINQRVANQDIYFEAADGATPAADTMFARFHWTGTNNTLVRCETQASTDTNNNEGFAEDLTQTSSASATYYTIELGQSGVYFSYGEDPETRLTRRLDKYPDIYTPLNFRIRGKNGASAPTTGTTITITVVKTSNVNRIDVGTVFHDEALQIGISDVANAVKGDKEHNTAGPSTSGFEVLPAIAKASDPTYSEGNVVGLRTTLTGDVAVTLAGEAVVLGAGSAAIGKLTANSGVDIGDVDVTSLPANASVNVTQVAGNAILTGAGSTGTGSPRVTIASDQAVIPVKLQSATSGGQSGYTAISTAAVLSAAIKASAGQVYGYSFFNNTAAAVFVRFYNMTTAPGTGDTPVRRIMVPANGGVERVITNGMEFSTGIGIRGTGLAPDNDATALTANTVLFNVDYK